MKYLAVCSSSIQIMFVLNLKSTILRDDIVEVIFTDTLNGYKKLVDNSNRYKIFDAAYAVESFNLSRRKGIYRKRGFFHNILFLKNRKKYVSNLLNIEWEYDAVMFSNVDDFTCGIYDCCYQKNRKIKLFLFEDGYSTYCVQGNVLLKSIEKNKKIMYKIMNLILGIKTAVLNIEGQFLYDVESIEWEAYFRRIPVKKFDSNNEQNVNRLNLLFGIDEITDTYDEPVIFFEESYRTEGIPMNDVEIVNNIASWIGKENIIVKIHPRNKDNVYKKLGYKTNVDTLVPWEVIFINNPQMENKLLISVASGSIATPYTMLGKETHSVALVDMKQVNPSGWISEYYDYLRRKIFKVRPDIFSCPRDEVELKIIVQEFVSRLGEKNENSSIRSN